jgi:hypothetical protein
MPREWNRGTADGSKMRKTRRTEQIGVRITEELDQLLKALAYHHEMPLNGLIAWALKELAAHGVRVGRRPPDMGIGLKRPKARVQATNKYSAEEDILWKELKATFGCSYPEVLALALIELYWREPVVLRKGNVGSHPRSREEGLKGDGRDIAA